MYQNSDYYESARALSGWLPNVQECHNWLRKRRDQVFARIDLIPFEQLINWHQDEKTGNFVHKSGRFFSIQGLQVANWPSEPGAWDQPIILQDEIGFLGFIAKKIDGVLHFLVQAKIEPGNVNFVQLSPTIQATRSNFLQVHGGRPPTYLEYFQDDHVRQSRFDQFQSEQGTRFLDKLNRNLVIEIGPEVDLEENEDFCWMTIGQIKALTCEDNLVNMDSRSVISCLDYYSDPTTTHHHEYDLSCFGDCVLHSMSRDAHSEHSDKDVLEWITSQRFKTHFDCHRIPLNRIQGWHQTDSQFRSDDHNFSVIATQTEIENREVVKWTQPMMQQHHSELFGFLCQMRHGTLHFLAHLQIESGLRGKAEIGPTTQCCISEPLIGETKTSREFLDWFLAPNANIHIDVMQSEEGGRFYHEQNLNMVVQIDESARLDLADNFRWLTLRQLLNLIRYSNYINIQARSVLSLLDINAGKNGE